MDVATPCLVPFWHRVVCPKSEINIKREKNKELRLILLEVVKDVWPPNPDELSHYILNEQYKQNNGICSINHLKTDYLN